MDEKQLHQIKADYFSPAEINNLYFNIRDNPCLFINELIRLSHIDKEKQNTWTNNC